MGRSLGVNENSVLDLLHSSVLADLISKWIQRCAFVRRNGSACLRWTFHHVVYPIPEWRLVGLVVVWWSSVVLGSLLKVLSPGECGNEPLSWNPFQI